MIEMKTYSVRAGRHFIIGLKTQLRVSIKNIQPPTNIAQSFLINVTKKKKKSSKFYFIIKVIALNCILLYNFFFS